MEQTNGRPGTANRYLFLAGDSTMARNRINTYPQTGWGQALDLYIADGWIVRNFAKNGRSSKSFIEEGLLAEIDSEIREGDLLLIQFGHNDEKEQDPSRYTEPFGTYQEYLTQYLQVARSHGAVPVLLTSIYRRHFDENGIIKDFVHGSYPEAMIELAQREKTACVDVCASSKQLLMDLGDEKSKSFFMNFGPGIYPNYPDGLEDNTHLRYEGAVAMAGLAANGLKALGGEFAEIFVC